MSIDAHLETVAAFDHAQAVDAAQPHATKTNGLVKQLQAVLPALAPCFLHGPFARRAELQPQTHDGDERQQQEKVG